MARAKPLPSAALMRVARSPGVQLIEDRLRFALTQLPTRFDVEKFAVSFNRIQCRDAFQRLRSNRAFIGRVQVEELAACMSKAVKALN